MISSSSWSVGPRLPNVVSSLADICGAGQQLTFSPGAPDLPSQDSSEKEEQIVAILHPAERGEQTIQTPAANMASPKPPSTAGAKSMAGAIL